MRRAILKTLSLLLAVVTVFTYCLGCNYEVNNNEYPPTTHVCVYNKKVTTENYKSNDATCLKKAKYFYSCECGNKGNNKYEYGKVVDHFYENGKCIWCKKTQEPIEPSTPNTPSTPTTPSQPSSTNINVYITPTGKRYHYSKSCAGKNATLTTKDKALKQGLTACKKCG